MSDAIQHECGIAYVRLLKPFQHYVYKYGTPAWGINRLYLLMEKQHNRGQDGAGVATVKLNLETGNDVIDRIRSVDASPIQDIFSQINEPLADLDKDNPEKIQDSQWIKDNLPFFGEILLGHLRYGTYGKNKIQNCHPFLRRSNWLSRNLLLAGNFNMTNVGELFETLVDIGQHPREKTDTITVLEKIGHFLDEENTRQFRNFRRQKLDNFAMKVAIEKNLDIGRILKESAKKWDGGYLIGGVIGHGDSFFLRDPNGIRPGYYYVNDEVAVVASERVAIQTTFNVASEDVLEIPPGTALVIKADGEVLNIPVLHPGKKLSCSFERIYFSRGNDGDIYHERKQLGIQLVSPILKVIHNDLKNTVFSYIPNTAESAFFGMIEGMRSHMNEFRKKAFLKAGRDLDEEGLDKLLSYGIRQEKIAVKDAKLRTFITNDDARNSMVAHVYDITYGTVKEGDNLVILDDSIVRGTTLRESIITILDRLSPKKIVIVSSAPQIRFPDCYGIDMAKIGDLIAFQAAIALLKETGQEAVIDQVYRKCLEDEKLGTPKPKNHVKGIYSPFKTTQISQKIAEMLQRPEINAKIRVVYQSLEGLHKAIPNHRGDWYFSGNYPTRGGNRVANRSFINYIEKRSVRAY